MPRVATIKTQARPMANWHRMLTRLWDRYWRWRAAKATMSILSGLSDRTLKDIGIDRSEIGSVVYGALGEPRRSPSRRIGCAHAVGR